jgi:hypothetical protein
MVASWEDRPFPRSAQILRLSHSPYPPGETSSRSPHPFISARGARGQYHRAALDKVATSRTDCWVVVLLFGVGVVGLVL